MASQESEEGHELDTLDQSVRSTTPNSTDNQAEPSSSGLEGSLQELSGAIRRRMKIVKEEAAKERAAFIKKVGCYIKKVGCYINYTLGLIIGALALFFTIYGLYHFTQPANQAAARANYYNWLWTICPAE